MDFAEILTIEKKVDQSTRVLPQELLMSFGINGCINSF